MHSWRNSISPFDLKEPLRNQAPKTSADLDDEVGVLDEVGLLHVDVLRPHHLRLHFHHLLSVQQKNFLISNF